MIEPLVYSGNTHQFFLKIMAAQRDALQPELVPGENRNAESGVLA